MSQKGIRRFIPENDLLDPTLAITKMLEPRNELGILFGTDLGFLLKSGVFILALVVFGFIFNFYIPNILEVIMITILGIIATTILLELVRALNKLSEKFHILGILSVILGIFIFISIFGFSRMIVKILGLVDLFAVVILLFSGILPPRLIMIFALLLIAKGTFFAITGNFISILDIIVAIYLVFIAYGISYKPITVIALIYLAQKAFLSFI